VVGASFSTLSGSLKIMPYTHTNIHTHTYTHTYIHTGGRCIRQHPLRLPRNHAIHTHTYTHTHTYIHTQVVGASFSTLSGSLEIMPFKALDYMLPSSLSLTSVRQALDTIMESPLLGWFESVLHKYGNNKPMQHNDARLSLGFYHK
jgi:hypothetical protein